MHLGQHVAEMNEKGWRQVSEAAGGNVARAVWDTLLIFSSLTTFRFPGKVEYAILVLFLFVSIHP